jgi:azobenzene reductase
VTKPRVLLIGGSLATPSHTGALLRVAERSLAVHGARTCLWDVATRRVCALEPDGANDAAARVLAAAARTADAVVIASPLYHGSYSGVVKDALDHLSARELEGKPVALLSHSGGFPSTQALDHLRHVVRALLAFAIPRQVVTVDADYVLDHDRYSLVNEAIEGRLGALAEQLVWTALRLRPDLHEPSANGDSARALAGTTERRS